MELKRHGVFELIRVHVATLSDEMFFIDCTSRTLLHHLKSCLSNELGGAKPWQQQWVLLQNRVAECKERVGACALEADLGPSPSALERQLHLFSFAHVVPQRSVESDDTQRKHVYFRVVGNFQQVPRDCIWCQTEYAGSASVDDPSPESPTEVDDV